MARARALAPGGPWVDITAALASSPTWIGSNANISLLWHRFLPAHDRPQTLAQVTSTGVDFSADWTQASQGTAPEVSRAQKKVKELADQWHGFGVLQWFSTRAAHLVDEALVHEAHLRRQQMFDSTAAITFAAETAWRAAVGLGNAAPVLNSGITIHPAYGFPVLPGPSIKGLARHFLEEEVAALLDDDQEPDSAAWQKHLSELRDAGIEATGSPAELAGFLCGAETAGGRTAAECHEPNGTDEASTHGHEGAIVFHDGWAELPGTWFEPDVLTCHHPDYYKSPSTNAPNDRESPNPVHFLCVRPGVKYRFGLGLTSTKQARELSEPQRRAVLVFSQHLVKSAFKMWGIGAKTGAGYGRLR